MPGGRPARYGRPAAAIRTALDRMLRSLGLNDSQIPRSVDERSSLFRSMLSGRRMLVLLDNASHEEQVRPLLAASRGCATIITCRGALSGIGEYPVVVAGPAHHGRRGRPGDVDRRSRSRTG